MEEKNEKSLEVDEDGEDGLGLEDESAEGALKKVPKGEAELIKKEEDLSRLITVKKPEPKSLSPELQRKLAIAAGRKKLFYSFLFISILVALNLVFVISLFYQGWASRLASLEGIPIGETKFILQNGAKLGWSPLWYLGFPFSAGTAPVLPFILAALAFALKWFPLISIYRLVLGIIFLFGAVNFYLFLKYLTKKEFIALVGAFLYSAPPFLVAIFVPEIRADFSQGGFGPIQLLNLFKDGDPGHFLSLAILPLNLLLLLHTLRFPSYKNYLLTSILLAVAVLSGLVGVYSLVILSVIVLFSEIVLGRLANKLKTAFWLVLITAGLTAGWANLSFLQSAWSSLAEIGIQKGIISLVPLFFAVLPVVGTGLFLLFDRKPRWQPFLIAGLWSLVYLIIVLSWSWAGKLLAPAPAKLLAELHLGLTLLLTVILGNFLNLARSFSLNRLSKSKANFLTTALIVIMIGLGLGLLTSGYADTQKLLKPSVNLEQSEETKLVNWLKDNDSEKERVFVSGSLSFWLNALTELPQVKGGSGLGAVNPWWQKASKEIESGESGAVALAWLEIFKVKYLVVNEPQSRVVKNDFSNPGKFADLPDLTPVFKDDGNIIYEVNFDNSDLAQVVPVSYFDNLPSLAEVADESALRQYLNYLEAIKDKREVAVNWRNNEELEIRTSLNNNEGLALALSYHPNWSAWLNGQRLLVKKDPLGFILIETGDHQGEAIITLKYGLGFFGWLGLALSGLTIILLILYGLRPVRKRIKNYMDSHQKIPQGVLIRPNREESFIDMMITDPASPEFAAKTKQYYKEVEDYDWVEATDNFTGLETFFNRNRERMTKKLIGKFGSGDKYLDLGCGTGLLLRHLPPGSVGLDINPRHIAKARRYAPEAVLVLADAEKIPFPDNSFSTVVCNELLDRLADPKKVLEEVKRALRPGGVLVGTIARVNPMWRMRFLASASPVEPFRKEYSRTEIEKLLGSFEKVLISPALSYMTWAFAVKKRG